MHARITAFLHRVSLAQQFMLVSLVILLISMLGLGWWVGKQIETGVVNRIGAEKALYVNSFIHPVLENYDPAIGLSQEDFKVLDSLVKNSPLGQNIVSFKIWDLDGLIVYSTFPNIIGRKFVVNQNLARAMQGQVVAIISDLSKPEDMLEREQWDVLLETYSPVTRSSTTQITAVVEFYQTLDALNVEITRAKRSSWLVLGVSTLVIYLIQSFFVQRASDTIHRQGIDLKEKVTKLTELLNQNAELHERVKRASSRSAAINEQVLRRISAELHDGPAQDLGYALLRFDGIGALLAECSDQHPIADKGIARLKEIESSLQHALLEIRAISSGMGLPELTRLTLEQTLDRVVNSHERRTRTQVLRSFGGSAQPNSLSIKIITYRLVQEALNNAFRHAGGKDQQVRATWDAENIFIEVSDHGPGFNVDEKIDQEIHTGLSGLQNRVDSIGGRVEIESKPGSGTILRAYIPLQTGDQSNE